MMTVGEGGGEEHSGIARGRQTQPGPLGLSSSPLGARGDPAVGEGGLGCFKGLRRVGVRDHRMAVRALSSPTWITSSQAALGVGGCASLIQADYSLGGSWESPLCPQGLLSAWSSLRAVGGGLGVSLRIPPHAPDSLPWLLGSSR